MGHVVIILHCFRYLYRDRELIDLDATPRHLVMVCSRLRIFTA